VECLSHEKIKVLSFPLKLIEEKVKPCKEENKVNATQFHWSKTQTISVQVLWLYNRLHICRIYH